MKSDTLMFRPGAVLGRDVSHPCVKRMPDISTSSPDSDDGENSSLPGSESKNEGIPERAGGGARERSKLSKAHCAEVDDLKQRSMKRKVNSDILRKFA